MEGPQQNLRRVRIATSHGVVEGRLRVNAMLRTLDDLNVVARNFVTLTEPTFSEGDWAFQGREVAINKTSILYVLECAGAPPQSAKPPGGRFSRASVRLRLGPLQVEGFVHVPPGGMAVSRLAQSSHPFIALTSASVVGPTLQFAAPFLAINRDHVLAAEEVQPEQPPAAEPAISFQIDES